MKLERKQSKEEEGELLLGEAEMTAFRRMAGGRSFIAALEWSGGEIKLAG